jgi:formylglycine-generating enzyme required for sulfatase activity
MQNLPSYSGKKVVIIAVVIMGIVASGIAVNLWTHRTPAIPGTIYYPGGAFPFGPDKKAVNLGPFYMDEAEVSNADFAAFCQATGCIAPTGAPDLPVVNITIAEARAFAKWKGKRLPTALEWERCARGVDSMLYPWGDLEDAALANVRDNPTLKTHTLLPVRSYRATPTYQMAGNAWEMLDTPGTPTEADITHFATLMTPAPTAQEKWIQIRGGSFNTPLSDAIAYKFVLIPERYATADIGFRCARSRQ